MTTVTLMMSSVEGMDEFTLESASNHRIRSRSASKDSPVARHFQLIVAFPAKYPSDGVLHFTVRASLSIGGKISGVGFDDSALITELAELARRHISIRDDDATGCPTSRLLIEIAKCFRCRVLQIIHGKPEHVEDEKLLTLVPGSYPSTRDSVDIDRDSATQNKVDVIESKAYRIPCPTTSAGKFSPRGLLLCFGYPRIDFEFLDESSKSPNMSDKYPRTYADMLLILREDDDRSDGSSVMSNEAHLDGIPSLSNIGRSRSLSPHSMGFDEEADEELAEVSESSELSPQHTRDRSATKPWSSTDSYPGSDKVSERASKKSAIKNLKKKIDRGNFS